MFDKVSAFHLNKQYGLDPCFIYGDGLKYTHTSFYPAELCYKFYIANPNVVLLVYGIGAFHFDFSSPVFLDIGGVQFSFDNIDDAVNYLIENYYSPFLPLYLNASLILFQNIYSPFFGGNPSCGIEIFTLPTCCPLDYSPIIQLLGGQ